jgi:excisionase family DNA binding protein
VAAGIDTVTPVELPLLTAADAARLLAMKESTVYALARQGRIPCIRIGRAVRFTRPMLERWLAGLVQGDDSS